MNLRLLYSDIMKDIVRLTIDVKNRMPESFDTVEDSMQFLSTVKSEDDLKRYASALRGRLVSYDNEMNIVAG